MTKRWVYVLGIVIMPAVGNAQLTLDSVYSAAKKNYPLIRQKGLIRQTADLTIANIKKSFLPQVSVSGQASYQSDVTRVEVPLAGIKIEPPSKDQYRFVADVNQLLYDGGQLKQQQVLQELNAKVEEQKVEVEMYKVQDRVNQLYLGILYLDEQIKQVALIQKDIQTGIRRVEAQVENGVAFRSNLHVLQAEELRTGQRKVELIAGRKAFIEILSLFMGHPLDENTSLIKPDVTSIPKAEIARPELELFNDQVKALDHRYKIIRSANLPRTSLFVQGGYGRPGLNMLKNEFDLFYVGGIRFSWSLAGLYTNKRDREIVEVSKRIVDVQKETFLFNTNTQIKQQQSEIDKLRQLVESDNAIIDLRVKVKEAARAQLENGVITANDYLREVNAEDMARQTQITHQLQLLQAQINYLNIIGR
ncbi:MAG TPA: TolC family protein [Chitinophagaceae bacterium]